LALRAGFVLRWRALAFAGVGMRFWGKRCSRLVGRSLSNPPTAILNFGRVPRAGSEELAPRYWTADNDILNIVRVRVSQWY